MLDGKVDVRRELDRLLCGLRQLDLGGGGPVAGPALPCAASDSFWFSYWLEEKRRRCEATSSKLEVRRSLTWLDTFLIGHARDEAHVLLVALAAAPGHLVDHAAAHIGDTRAGRRVIERDLVDRAMRPEHDGARLGVAATPASGTRRKRSPNTATRNLDRSGHSSSRPLSSVGNSRAYLQSLKRPSIGSPAAADDGIAKQPAARSNRRRSKR